MELYQNDGLGRLRFLLNILTKKAGKVLAYFPNRDMICHTYALRGDLKVRNET